MREERERLVDALTPEEADRISDDAWSAITTLELAAEIHKSKPGKALRKTLKALLPRLHPYVQTALSDVILNNMYPVGALSAFKAGLLRAVNKDNKKT